jgi:hypothetical protein
MFAVSKARPGIPSHSLRRLAATLILGTIAGAAPLAASASLAEMRAAQMAGPDQSRARVAAAAAVKSRAPYQAYLSADCLQSSNFCKFFSETIPVGKRLEIHRVACQGWHSSSSLPSFVTIAYLATDAGMHIQRIDFLEASYAPANGGSVWSISEKVLTFIPAGQKLRIDLNSGATGVGSYGCTLSGFLATLSA